MTNWLLSLTIMLLTAITSVGQDISRSGADSMLKALNKAGPGIERINLLLGLAEYQIRKPEENMVDFDSATTYLNEAKRINKSVKSSSAYGYQLLLESYLNWEKKQTDTARKLAEKAISILESANNKTYLGKAYYELSNHYDYKDPQQLPKKITLVEDAVNAFQQAGNIERKASGLKMLGDLYNIHNDNEKAIDALKLSLDAYKSINYAPLQGVYSLLGRVYSSMGNEKQALEYELIALKTAESLHDTTMQLCEINSNLGNIYAKSRQTELSLKYYKDAFETAKKYNDSYTIALLIANISIKYSALSRPKEAIDFLTAIPKKYLKPNDDREEMFITLSFFNSYFIAKQYNNAKRYVETLLKLENSPVLEDSKFNIIRGLAAYYVSTKQYDKARLYLARERVLSNRLGPAYVAGNEKLWYKLDSSQGNFQSAFKHLLTYKAINDSLFNETKSKQLQQLQIEYETAKKEDSLKLKTQDILLLKEKNYAQQANLKQTRIVKNVTIAGIFLAFIIIGLLYRQYRHKQNSNDIISNKNELLQHLLTEKEWLLKEIHHRVKNNLQIVMSLLNSQSAYIENDAALTAIHDSQHRVQAMSLIHQKLYNTENVSTINMSTYIHELILYLRDSFDTGRKIHFEYNIEPLELDVSQAVPLGLILNEAITNSIKYAFPDNRNGLINISLSNTAPKHYLLSISDNGIGMPETFIARKPGSLGMSLMTGLSEDLDGSFAIENNNGTTIKISFVHDHSIKRLDESVSSFITSNQLVSE